MIFYRTTFKGLEDENDVMKNDELLRKKHETKNSKLI